jgi:glycine/D-amino acid oxidase-like deaminating enzyme
MCHDRYVVDHFLPIARFLMQACSLLCQHRRALAAVSLVIMTISIWQTPTATTPQRADVVIIGAGIIGAYLAFRLAGEHQNVTVLEARHVAAGASGRNGGLLLTGVAHSYKHAVDVYGRDTTRALWHTTICNRERMIELATKLGTPVRRCGSYILACDQAEADELRQSVALMHEDGFGAEWHAADPLHRGFAGAISNPGDGAIQSALLAAALLQASGVRVCEASEVYAIESGDDGVLLRARGGDVLAQQVILATNAYTPLLVPEFKDLIMPARGQVLATAPAPSILDRSCYCDYGFEYFQQLPDGRFVLGGYRRLAIGEETTYADQTTSLIQNALDQFLERYFPELSDVPIERRWSGTMGFTPDGLPLVGTLHRDERIAFAVGFNGHGLGLGVMVVEELLQSLSGGAAGMFDAERLASWKVSRLTS